MFDHPKTTSIMSTAFDIPPETITTDIALGVSAAWTSLSHMRLIFAVEDELGRRLTPNEIVGLSNAQQVDALLSDGASSS